jgi:hypothetical protein
LDRRLDRTHSQSGHCGIEETLLPLPEIKHRLSSPGPITILTELFWLHSFLNRIKFEKNRKKEQTRKPNKSISRVSRTQFSIW